MSKYSENMPPDILGAIGWMFEHINPDTTFLDFGCSTGYFGSYIKNNKNCKVYGVEISSDKIEASKVLDGVYSFDLDSDWPEQIYERKYDYLFFGDVLEHLKDPTDALKKTHRLLKDNGKIFVSIPNIGHISVRLELLRGSFIYETMGILDNTHLQYFTLDTFTTNAKKAGFNAKLIDYTANDIPREIIEKQLSDIGLKADKKFWHMTQSMEARAYQYKFMLEIASTPKKSFEISNKQPTIIKPLQFRDDVISDFQEQLKSLDDHSKEQAKIIEHYSGLAQRLENENQSLKTKRLVRLESSIKGLIKRPKA